MTIFNCDCDAAYPKATLAELRVRMLKRLGYSAQLVNPPANVVTKINDILAEAQREAYNEYEDFRTERWFSWDLVAGERFYDFPDNEDVCTKKWDPTRISYVGVYDDDHLEPLTFGIPPEILSNPQVNSRPYRYDIRQCIELWPAPESSNTYKLMVKGQFGLLPFVADGDYTTIDPDVIFYGAMFMFKDDRGDKNAGTYGGKQINRIEQLRAAAHFTSRYVPNSENLDPMPKPIFLPLEP